MIVKQHDLKGSLSFLEKAEKGLPQLLGHIDGPQPFRLIGGWLIHEGVLLNQALKRLRPGRRHALLPSIGQFSFKKLSKARFLGQSVPASSNAYAIVLKSNIRAFYATPDFQTLKIPAPGLGVETLSHEVSVRRDLEAVQSIRIPRIIESCSDDDRSYILEESICGWKLNKKKASNFITSAAVPKILDFYEEQGPRLALVDDIIDLDFVKQCIATINDTSSVKLREEDYIDIISKIERLDSWNNCSVVMIYGHGDLCVNNIICGSNGEVYLIDWEHSAPMMLFEDMIKLLRDFPDFRPLIEARIRRWFGIGAQEDILTVNQQLLIGHVCRFTRKFDAWRKHHSMEGKVAQRRTQFYFRFLLRELLDFRAASSEV